MEFLIGYMGGLFLSWKDPNVSMNWCTPLGFWGAGGPRAL